MHQTLYRKYRPKNFSEVVGQKVIVKTLKNAIKNNILSHAYLFTGPRGTGKTSIAKILAKTVNCMNLENTIPCDNCDSCNQINSNQSIDIIEIDAASNNGVDEIRELRSKVGLVPSIGKYKIYIIDEVHMLTTGAFNALLKTLEEPPEHIIFILATTEPHKIPLTILSRCQRFDFKKISNSDMKMRIEQIINAENIKISENALNEIIRLSDGGMRDCLSILDQLVAYCDEKIEEDDVHEINGTLTSEQMRKLIKSIASKQIDKIFEIIDYYDENGKNFVKLTEEIITYLRNIILIHSVPKYSESLNLDKNLYEIEELSYNDALKYIEYLNKTINDMKDANNPRIIFELAILKMLNDSKVKNENINISQEIKAKLIANDEKQVEEEQPEEIIVSEELQNLQKIRLNNTLCYFDKKYYLSIKNMLKELSSYLLNPDYGEYASILMDGELKAAGNGYLIFVYSNNRMANIFNSKIEMIENMLKNVFQENYHVIATDINDWNYIKEEYNSKKRKFTYIEEPKLEKKIDENLNEIEKDFNDIIEYN